MIATLNSCCPPSRNRVPYSTFKYPLSNKQPCMWTRSQYHVKSSRKRSFFCKLCACKQKHSSVVGRLTETDQIQIRDDTTSRACLRTSCYTGITTTVTTRIITWFPTNKTSHAIQHIQITIVNQTTMQVNQKSISHRIITACEQGVNVRYFKQHHWSMKLTALL